MSTDAGDSHAIRLGATPKWANRFWQKVSASDADACWEWQAARSPFPEHYGQFGVNGHRCLSHRLAFELVNGPIPDGMVVRHKCDNPPCCNPAHLVLGTHRDNRHDAMEKNRHAFGVRNGRSKLTEQQVIDIRRRAAAGQSVNLLASLFRCDRKNIRAIITGRTWQHVTLAPLPA